MCYHQQQVLNFTLRKQATENADRHATTD